VTDGAGDEKLTLEERLVRHGLLAQQASELTRVYPRRWIELCLEELSLAAARGDARALADPAGYLAVAIVADWAAYSSRQPTDVET
jgi:hypothetical protein